MFFIRSIKQAVDGLGRKTKSLTVDSVDGIFSGAEESGHFMTFS